jgi:hypothetical protein
VYQIGRDDMTAMENFLGSKKFLFGDRPCNEDSVVFSFVAMIVNVDVGPLNAHLTSKSYKSKFDLKQLSKL